MPVPACPSWAVCEGGRRRAPRQGESRFLCLPGAPGAGSISRQPSSTSSRVSRRVGLVAGGDPPWMHHAPPGSRARVGRGLRQPVAWRSGDPSQRISDSPSPAHCVGARCGNCGDPATRGLFRTDRRARAYLSDAHATRPPLRRKAAAKSFGRARARGPAEHRPACRVNRREVRSNRGNGDQSSLRMVRYEKKKVAQPNSLRYARWHRAHPACERRPYWPGLLVTCEYRDATPCHKCNPPRVAIQPIDAAARVVVGATRRARVA